MTAADRLDEIEARADKAADGPWEKDERWCQIKQRESGAEVVVCFDDADSEFIAHARTDVPALVAALRSVLDVCENYPVPPSDEDVTGAVLSGMEKLERLIRAAIHDSLGEVAL